MDFQGTSWFFRITCVLQSVLKIDLLKKETTCILYSGLWSFVWQQKFLGVGNFFYTTFTQNFYTNSWGKEHHFPIKGFFFLTGVWVFLFLWVFLTEECYFIVEIQL